jgi:transposase InsO family protein
LTVEQMCRETSVSRASFYRYWQQREPSVEETELRERIQQLALAQRSYGYRRIAALLRREGRLVTHKRVLRLLREDNLLAIRKKHFVATTDARHSWRLWPNLARWARAGGPNQLWVADITYLRLRGEFCYLAVVLDVWSRRVVG